jgi:RNA methyltransferase, TrmH family
MVQVYKKDIKFVRSLGQKKFRQESGCFIAEGLKLTREALQSQWPIHSLYTTDDDFARQYPQALKVTSHEMEMMSQLHTPSAHLVVVKNSSYKIELSDRPKLAVLDGISDPGNLGTILRTADWFGIRHIFCTPNCVELTNPKVVQATMGSIFRTKVEYADKEIFVPRLKAAGYLLAGAVLNGTSVYQCALSTKHALVIGSESHGISEAMMSLLDQKLTIPGEPGAESLNASVAAGILLMEHHRQTSARL